MLPAQTRLYLRISLFCLLTVDVIYFIIWFGFVRLLIVDATIFLGVVCGLAWCAGYICIIRDTPQVLTTYLGIAIAATLLLLGAFFWGIFLWLDSSSMTGVILLWHFIYYVPSLACNIGEIVIAYRWWRGAQGGYEEIGETEKGGVSMTSIPSSRNYT